MARLATRSSLGYLAGKGQSSDLLMIQAQFAQYVITYGRLGKSPPSGGIERSVGHGPSPFNNPDATSSDKGGIILVYGTPEGAATNVTLYAERRCRW